MPYIGNIIQDFSVSTAMLNTDSVTSIKVLDGTIINADINASAAIAGTKISPDFGSQNITTTNDLNGKSLNLTHTSPQIQFIDSNGNPDYTVKVDSGLYKIIDATNSNADRFVINTDGHIDIAGNVDFGAGIDVTGNIVSTGAVDAIGITIGGNTPSLNFNDANDNPDFRFLVNSNSFILEDTTNSENRLVVNSDGHIDIAGNLDVGAGLDVTGDITATGSLTISSANPQILLTDTGDNPDYVIKNNNGAIQINDNTNGATRLAINTDGHLDIAGNVDFGAGIDVTGNITTTGNITATGGQLTLETGNEEQIHRFWDNNSDSDIYGLLSGSTFGTIVEGANNGHHVIALRDNDNNDSFAIISGGGDFKTGSPAETYDTLIARFKADGNTFIKGSVGIGTESPAYTLELEGSGSGGGLGVSLGIQNTSSDPAGINLLSGHGNWSIYNSHSVGDALEFRDESASTTPMLIDSNGNVGIGTTNPNTVVHVSDADAELTLERTGTHSTSDAPLIQFKGRGPNSVMYNFAKIDAVSTGSNNAGHLRFYTNASGTQSQQMIINDVGTVGINSDGTNFGQLSVGIPSQAGGAAIQVMNSASGGGDGGTTNIVLRSVNSNGSNWAHAEYRAQSHKFLHQGTTKVTINTNGLCFNTDTAVQNALDDYEEGTWTPSITGTTSNLGSTSGRAFMYRKIGSVVFFSFDFFQENNNMSLNASCVIDGLPFDSPNLPNNFLSNVSVGSIGNAATGNVHATVRNYFTNAAQIVILDAVANSRHFMGQGFYFVA